MKDIAGKVAFVTGGASGIGLAMAQSFSAAGMKVAITDIEQAALDRVKDEFARSNAEVIYLKVDVTDRDAMEQAARETEAAFGKVHVVCNNAGVAVGGRIDVMEYNDWDWVMGVNLDGVINGVQTFVNRIKAHGEGGHFVNTASMAGQMPIPGGSIYTTSKYAVVGMSEVMRTDLARYDRPANLLRETDTSQLGLGELSAPVMADMLEASVIGDMVLAAVLANDLYIFSHPGLKPVVDARSAAINESFARWTQYRKDHGI
jgi:NADP-dependent 3-hydroxy acid dehydrogenase YdfG